MSVCFTCVCALFFWLVSRFLNNDSKKTWKAGTVALLVLIRLLSNGLHHVLPETKESFLHACFLLGWIYLLHSLLFIILELRDDYWKKWICLCFATYSSCFRKNNMWGWRRSVKLRSCEICNLLVEDAMGVLCWIAYVGVFCSSQVQTRYYYLLSLFIFNTSSWEAVVVARGDSFALFFLTYYSVWWWPYDSSITKILLTLKPTNCYLENCIK